MSSYVVSPVTAQAMPERTMTAGQTMSPNTLARVPTAAPITQLLPPAPAQDTVVLVRDISNNAAANNITVDGNGQTIDGAATSVLAINGIEAAYLFDAGQWRRVLIERRLGDAAATWSRLADVSGLIPAGGAAPTGTGYTHNTAGVQDAAARTFIAFDAGALPAAGQIRNAHIAVGNTEAWQYRDSIGTDRRVIALGQGDFIRIGALALSRDDNSFGHTHVSTFQQEFAAGKGQANCFLHRDSNANRMSRRDLFDNVQTIGAVSATIVLTPDIADGSSGQISAYVQARNAAGDSFVAWRRAAFERQGAATALVGVVDTIGLDKADAAIAAAVTTIDANLLTMRIRCTGVAAQTIEWQAWCDVFLWTP